MFSFNRSILDENGAPTLSAVLEGKVLRVVDGEHLASSTAMSSWAQPAQCNPQCELDIIAKDAERLSLSMGGSLTRQLAIVLRGDGYASKPNEAVADEPLVLSTYTLAFSKFSGQQIILLEDYLIALPYYVDHEYLISIADATELSLKTTTGSRQLMGDLLRMLNSTGLQADVSFLANTFFIENSVNKVRRVRGPPDGF